MELGGTSPAEVAHVVLVFVYSSASTEHGPRQSALATRQQRPGRTRVPGTRRASSQNTTGCGTRSSASPFSLSPPTVAPPGSEKRTRSRENTQDAGAFAAGKVKLLRFSSGFDRRASLLEVPCISHTPYQEGSFFWLNARGAACGLMTSCRSLRRIQQLTSRRLRAAYDQLSSYSDS